MMQLTDKYFAVEVPDWANGYRVEIIPQADVFWLVCYEIGDYDEPKREKEIDLPPGTYRFLFTTKTATEEDARKVVKSIPCGRKKIYKGVKDDGNEAWYESPLKSLHSLLRSKGLDPNKNYAIIEKISSDE